ncbi:MAG: ribosome small subunit-dependent GTPase A [Gemmatimonadetes bacterium]|nr:ribosome small subunit-dependent GTPase A [Gemmatimonadota bacterium]
MNEFEAVVLSGTGGVWTVLADSGERHDAALRGRLKQDGNAKLAVGDRVAVERDASDVNAAWAITTIHPRKSKLARRAPSGARGERIVAANIDQVVVVFAAAKPEPHVRMLDRFLVIAEGNDLTARIVINKVELVEPAVVDALVAPYERAGYVVHRTSVKQRLGLDELHEALAGRTSALSGPSGVGKSSLLNAMYPELTLRIGEISESVNKGRHTTVGAVLIPLTDPSGGFVADTPGLREVGLWGMPPEDLDRCFPEFRPVLGSCKYQDCSHDHEPSCAVRAAVDRGDVSAARYESYLKLLSDLPDPSNTWD